MMRGLARLAAAAAFLWAAGMSAAPAQILAFEELDGWAEDDQREALAAQAAQRPRVLPVSALTGEGVDALLDAVSAAFDEEKTERLMAVPFSDGRRRAWLHAEGVVLDDDPHPVRAQAAEAVTERHLRLTLTEGKYHQVKRMLAAVGNRVEGLHRSSIGGLELDGSLPPGQWRWLTADEVRSLVEKRGA